MPRDQIATELRQIQQESSRIAQQKDRLSAELQRLNDEATRLLMEEQLLAQVLRLHQWADAGVHGAQEVVDATAAAAPQRKRENISANVLAIVRQGRGLDMTPQDVQAHLNESGVHADLRTIRSALRRWAERGEIVKRGSVYHALDRDNVSLRDPIAPGETR